jgi:hypothetical protein
MNKRHRLLAVTAGIAALVVLGSGCGDDGDGDVTASPTSAAATATAPAAATSTPVATAAPVIDPCTIRTALDGQALSPGPDAELDGSNEWQLCIGGAAAGSSEKYLFRSDDGGASWTLISMTTLGNPPPEPGVGELPNGNAAEVLLFADEDHGWLGLSSPGQNLYRSQDGGVSWTVIDDLPPAVPVTFIEFSDALNGTVTTSESTWTTADGGDTWTETP